MSDKMRGAAEALVGWMARNAGAEHSAPAEYWALREALAEQSAQGEAVPDGMWKISKLIATLQSTHDRFGDTCVWMRECKWGAAALHAKSEAEAAPPAPSEKPAQDSTTKLWTHAQWQARFCKHCGYDHSAGPICNALKAEQPAQGEAVADERLRKEFEVMLQCANWTGGHRDINFDRDEWGEYESYPVHISWNVYLRAIARPAPPPPSVQPAQGEAVAKAKLWDTLNAALMSRSGITLDNERDCYEAARQWAEAHGDAWSYKTAVQKLREERDTIAKLKVEALTLATPPAPVVPSIFRSVQDAKKNAQTSLAEDEYSALLKKLSGRDFYLLQRAMLAADPEVKP